LRASSQFLPIRVLIRIDRELKNAACGRTLSFFGKSYGAHAFMLCWQQLPPKAQLTILNRANDMIGLTPVPNIRA
jgi:hypothetical protein